MDPYKLIGIPEAQIKHPSDLIAVRQKAKKLFKRYSAEKNKFDAKKVLEAFDMIKQNLGGRLGTGDKAILGRSRMERMMDKHYNHQTKEIKKDKTVKKALKRAQKGEDGLFHLPGDKERVPTGRGYKLYKKRRRHRHHRSRRHKKKKEVEALAGLHRLAVVLPFEAKFGKAIKLLHRWMKEYMNVDNREYVFEVLQDIVDVDFLLNDPDNRQDVLITFEYVLNYFKPWFAEDDNTRALGAYWEVAANLACKCYTDDSFILSTAITRLNEALALLERHRDDLKGGIRFEDDYGVAEPVMKKPRKDRHMLMESPFPEGSPEVASLDSDSEDEDADDDHIKEELKKEEIDIKVESGVKLEFKADCKDEKGLKDGVCGIKSEAAVLGPAPLPAGPIELGDSDDGEVGAIDIGSDGDSVKEEEISLSSDCDSDDSESIEVMSDDLEGSLFPTPPAVESLYRLRVHYVDRCLATLFQNRGPSWARPKIDTFFQDLFYRRSVFADEQIVRIEAWQSRIKTTQKPGERNVGEANNPLEAHRPVVDARETRTILDSDSNVWASKQTFDSRETQGGRNVIR